MKVGVFSPFSVSFARGLRQESELTSIAVKFEPVYDALAVQET